ncbi:hypothetical protein BV25DRAFT_1820201 [Artomyces pyxidatus]|uniref:Uncharacterized protein n=1 Tax=Artomyces pyxidatus TaxID=48021 RepID=A0ACB8TF21_9AGAM|nr:hypothetical protein BV25DRAFT_1820201 [Artomyces pyxidatus]
MPSKTLPAPPPVSLDAPGGKPSKHATQLYTQPSFSASHPTNNTPVLRSQVQTPPQSPDGYQCVSEGTNAPVPVRRESQTRSPVRGRPLIFASLDAQPEEPPSSRRGPLIFNRRDQQQPDLRNGPKSPIRATPYGTRPPSWFGDPSSIDGMQPEVSSAPPPLIKQQPGSGPDPRVASTEPAHATRDVGGQAPRHASPAPQTSQSPLAQRPPHLNSAHSHPYDERAPSPPHHLRKTRHPTLSRGSVDLSNIPADSTSTPRSSTAHEHDPAATARARKSSRTLNGATSASLSDLGESAQPQHRASHRVLTKHRPITPVSPKSQPPPPLGSPAEIEPQRLGRKSWQAPSVAEARIMEAAPTPPEKADVRASFGEPAPLSARTGARTPVRAELQLRDIPDEPADEPEPAQALEEDRAEAYVLVPEVRPRQLPTPPSPEEYSRARARRRGEWLEKAPPEEVVDVAQQTLPTFYPLARHLQDPVLLAALLNYFSFYDWLVFSNTTKAIKAVLDRNRDAQEAVLERFLGTVGYTRWTWLTPEPLQLTLKELHAYMKGVSLPTHQYAHTAAAVLSTPPTPEQHDLTRSLKKATRAFTRVVLRLRAHAEAEAEQIAAFRRAMPLPPSNGNSRHHSSAGPPPSWSTGAASAPPARRALSRQTSRAPSPTGSTWSHNTSQVHLPLSLHDRREPSPSFSRFRSPLFRLRRAPLLQVFVPSPEGDWLSDSSILECEAELRKAGVLELLRAGDVVWDTAVGDEGNVGRLIWDGRYLIDLDYTYSPIGDLPRYLPTLAFPPSYFHRVIRIAGDKNPICHIDVRPWAEEIASNLQLLQDRVKTETPQGNYHTVVRWVHRSSFTIRPPQSVQPPMIVMPTKERRGVDPGWYGLVVVEAEGTNEGLEDLQERCRGAFPPRAAGPRAAPRLGERERTVWRIMRERSRPGEIWISTVSYKERLLP